MKIGIDARFYGPQGKGIGRYTEQLLKQLEELDQSNRYFVFLTKDNFNLYQPKNKNFQKVLMDYPWYSWKEQLIMPWKILKLNLNIVHFLHFNIPLLYYRPFIITIHDLTMHRSTQQASTKKKILYFLKKRLYFLVVKNAILRSKRILTVSGYTKQDILKHYLVDPNKIKITYESA